MAATDNGFDGADDDTEAVARGVRTFVADSINSAIAAALPGVIERIETAAATATQSAVGAATRQFAAAEAAAREARDAASAMNDETRAMLGQIRAEQERQRKSLRGLAELGAGGGDGIGAPVQRVAAVVAAPKLDREAIEQVVSERVGRIEEALQWLEHAVALLAELNGVSADRLERQVRERAARRAAMAGE